MTPDWLSDDLRRLLWQTKLPAPENITTSQQTYATPAFSIDRIQRAARLINQRRNEHPTEIWVYSDAHMIRIGLDPKRGYQMTVPSGDLVLAISQSAMTQLEREAAQDARIADAGAMTGLLGLPVRHIEDVPT